MSLLTLLLVIISEVCSIVGQLCFKVAMASEWANTRIRSAGALSVGVVAMAIGFFVWLGLLADHELSFLYPLEGINRLILLLAAAVLLKEQVTPRLWLGVILISIGVTLVAAS